MTATLFLGPSRASTLKFGGGERGRVVVPPLIIATAGIWLLSVLIWGLAAAAQHLPRIGEIVFRGSIVDGVGALLCGLAYLIIRRSTALALPAQLGIAAVLAVIGTAAYMLLLYISFYVILPMSHPPSRWMFKNTTTFVAVLWTFLAWFCVYFSLQFGAAAQRAGALALDAQNKMLRYQINPHFLFNAHNGLAALIHDGRNEEAERIVMSLSKFLRRSLEADLSTIIPLTSEIEMLREYIEVEGPRFGERITFVECFEDAALAGAAPGFVLQPLVENAMKHGLGPTTRCMTIRIGAAREDDRLKVWVEDNGTGGYKSCTPSLGVGLDNIRQRLRSFYGADAQLQTERLQPTGFRATLDVPWRLA